MNTPLDEHCKICGRVPFGQTVRLGFGHWRHEDCGLGEQAWLDYFNALSPSEQDKLVEFFNFSYPDVQHAEQVGGMQS
jgi:hypothetical protein